MSIFVILVEEARMIPAAPGGFQFFLVPENVPL